MSAFKELKKQLKLFASFSAGERLSILILFVLLLVVWLLLFLMPMWSGNTLAEKNAALQIVKSWEQEPRKKEVTTQIDHVALNSAGKKVVHALFLFNPNSVSEEQAIQLGMTTRQINNIFNYRSKGGVFRKKSDLGKLYAFDSLSYQRLKPYIDLPDSFVRQPKSFAERNHNSTYIRKELIVELNSADSAQLVALRGVGPYSASRILKHRNKLGGFVKTEQLKEVWGISDSMYQVILPQITLNAGIVQKIDINRATVEHLKNHPYVWKFALARAIVNYREQHGAFKTVKDMQDIILLPDTVLLKLEPYLIFE